MTARPRLAFVATTVAAALAGAAAPPAYALEVVAREADSGRTVTLQRGDTLRVSLKENPSTGFSWRISRKPSRRVLARRSNRFEAPPERDPPVAGAPGRRVIVWRAVGRGSTRLALRLVPPGGGKASERFGLRVRVR